MPKFSSALPGTGPLDIAFDFSGVEVLLSENGKAILESITVGTTPEYAKAKTVVTYEDLFALPADAPNEQLREVAVQFERGDTVRLTASRMEAQANVRFPLSDVIVNKEITDQYRYRLTAVRKSGVKISEWRTSDMEPFYILPGDLPTT